MELEKKITVRLNEDDIREAIAKHASSINAGEYSLKADNVNIGRDENDELMATVTN